MTTTTTIVDPAGELEVAALNLRNSPQRPVDAPLAEWLAKAAKTIHEQVIEESPECPTCWDGGCTHPSALLHDGGCGDWLTVYEDKCHCFDDALAVARALNGGA